MRPIHRHYFRHLCHPRPYYDVLVEEVPRYVFGNHTSMPRVPILLTDNPNQLPHGVTVSTVSSSVYIHVGFSGDVARLD